MEMALLLDCKVTRNGETSVDGGCICVAQDEDR
jgi:hypothetical protein